MAARIHCIGSDGLGQFDAVRRKKGNECDQNWSVERHTFFLSKAAAPTVRS